MELIIMAERKDLQRKYMQFQILRQQLNALIEEKMILDSKMNELRSTLETISKLRGVGEGEEIMSNIGPGTFIRADVKDVKNLIVNIGADVYASKTTAEASKILSGRLAELDKVDDEMITEINKLSQSIEKLEPELQRLAEASKEEKKK
jgi:prefoldin alpha subunit